MLFRIFSLFKFFYCIRNEGERIYELYGGFLVVNKMFFKE